MVDAIVTVQPNVPPVATATPQPPMVAPALTVVVMVAVGVNPLPEMRTDSPLGPSVGESVIDVVVTVNEADALSKLPSDPVAFRE